MNPLGVGAMKAFSEAMFGVLSVAFAIAVVAAVVSVVLRFRRGTPADRSALRWLAVVAYPGGRASRDGDRGGSARTRSDRRPVRGRLPSRGDRRAAGHRGRGAPDAPPRRDRGGGQPIGRVRVDRRHDHGDLRGDRRWRRCRGRSERTDDVFAAVAATAVAAVAFQPARRRAQRFADRLIYGDRASPYELVATFTERLDDASLPEVLPRMTTLIAEGTGADRIRIWLRSGPELHPVASWPADGVSPATMRLDDGELPTMGDPAFAVRHGGYLLGAITVAMPPQEPMTPATERLLTDLSAQAGLVLRNVALVEELQRSRQRIVSSQDEARRRLERDLHDGAQQRLVTLSLNLRMARERADASGDPDLTTSLGAAEPELARSLAELRELARGISTRRSSRRTASARPFARSPTGPRCPSRSACARCSLRSRGRGDRLLRGLRGARQRVEARGGFPCLGRGRGQPRRPRDRRARRRDRGRDAGRRIRSARLGGPRRGGRRRGSTSRSAAGAGSIVHAEIPCASR